MAGRKKAEGGGEGGGGQEVYLFYGTDDLSAKKAADACVERLCPEEERDFGLESFEPEGPSPNAETSAALLRDAMGALLTPPFLGGDKTVYLRRAPFFDPLGEPGRFADVKAWVEKLTELIKKGLPAGVHLVIWATKVNKTTAFYKACDKLGRVEGFDAPEYESKAQGFFGAVKAAAEEAGVKLGEAALEALVGRTGFSLRLATMEVEKLALYVGERGEATVEDVQRMVAPSRESKPWDFGDAYCTGRVDETLLVMQRLLAQKESPVAMIAMLETKLREMAIFRDALARGWCTVGGNAQWPKFAWASPLPAEAEAALGGLATDLRKGSPFKMARTAQQANKYPAARWFRWLNAAVDAHAAMTGDSALPPETTLEMFVLQTIGALKVAGGGGGRG